MTNYEKIMQYSIDDMAELLGDNICCTLCSKRFDICGCECHCKEHIKEWLQMEESVKVTPLEHDSLCK